MIRTSAINLVLKAGLVVTSFIFAIISILNISRISIYYPDFAISIFGETFMVLFGALIAIALAIWLLIRKYKFTAAFTYTILVFLGMLFNLNSIRFLSVAWPLFCMSLALSLRYYPRIRVIISKKLGSQRIEKMKIVPANMYSEDAEETEADEEIENTNHGNMIKANENNDETIKNIESEPANANTLDSYISDISKIPETIHNLDIKNSLNISENDSDYHNNNGQNTEDVNIHYARKHGFKSKVPRIKVAKKLTRKIAHKIGLGSKSENIDEEVQ